MAFSPLNMNIIPATGFQFQNPRAEQQAFWNLLRQGNPYSDRLLKSRKLASKGRFVDPRFSAGALAGGQSIVYPTFFGDKVGRQLQGSAGFDPLRYAQQTQQYLRMPDQATADWFTRRYLALLGMGR